MPPDLIPNPNDVPVPTPPPSAPDLLPESNKLPPTPTPGPNPADLIPQGIPIGTPTPTPKPLTEQPVKDTARFRQILTIAKRDPHAVEMWNKSAIADNLEYKREWLRQYDSYVSGVMRKLEPRLKATIVTWEAGQLSDPYPALSQANGSFGGLAILEPLTQWIVSLFFGGCPAAATA